MMRLSIRQRLTAWYAAALLLGLSIFGCGMWVSLRGRLIAGVDARLAQRIQGLQAAVGAEAKIRDRHQLRRELAEFTQEVPDGSIVQLRDPSGEVLAAGESQPVLGPKGARAAPYTEDLGGRQFRVLTAPLESAGSVFEAQVAISLEEILG